MSKHKILQQWVQSFLKENYLYFERADAYPNIRVIVPNYGDYIVSQDVLGIKQKSYTFVFIGYESIDSGTSDVNTDNMEIFDVFINWLKEQQDLHNFPDFGENCFDYEIIPLQNMANLATITEDGLAKYMLAVRIDYKEE